MHAGQIRPVGRASDTRDAARRDAARRNAIEINARRRCAYKQAVSRLYREKPLRGREATARSAPRPKLKPTGMTGRTRKRERERERESRD